MSKCSENAETTCKSYPSCDGCNAYGNKMMTDAEIEQALPFLAKYCKNEYNDIRVDEVLLGASDLINRQEAENEKLQKRVNSVEQVNVQLREELKETTEKFNCQQHVYTDLSDIIREKNAEIERLTAEKENLRCVIEDLSNNAEHAKAEAIKEFAERLKAECRQDRYAIQTSTKFGVVDKKYLRVVDESDIDNLVKEMVGDTE